MEPSQADDEIACLLKVDAVPDLLKQEREPLGKEDRNSLSLKVGLSKQSLNQFTNIIASNPTQESIAHSYSGSLNRLNTEVLSGHFGNQSRA